MSLYQEREGRKLKEFLEDYDDEKDDVKYYRGRELARRLADRSGPPPPRSIRSLAGLLGHLPSTALSSIMD